MHKLPRAVWMALLTVLLAACAQPDAAPVQSAATPAAPAYGGPDVVLTKSPTCSCCSGHQAYLEGAGFRVQVKISDDINAVKDVYAIPAEMRSCHTSVIGRYFVEGHVPLAAIQQLLAERPDIDGISLPGMPSGSPGMAGELAGPLVVYAVTDGRVAGEFGSF